MKTFQQFNEDLKQLQRGLETLEKQSAPSQRLAARREAAKQRSRDIETEYKERTAAETERRRRMQKRSKKRR